jgi:hypothetical protein
LSEARTNGRKRGSSADAGLKKSFDEGNRILFGKVSSENDGQLFAAQLRGFTTKS